MVRDRGGRVVADRRLVLDRTIVRLALPVRRAGAYSVSLDATAVNGRGARRAASFVATPPPPKPKPKLKPKRKPNPTRKPASKPGAAAKPGAGGKPGAAAKPGAKPAKKSAAPSADQGSAKRTKPGS